MPFLDKLRVERLDETRWKLTRPLEYQGESQTFYIPTGYVTDFASVPPFMRSIIDDTGKWTLAAILHDYAITDLIGPCESDTPGCLVHITSRDADGLFRRVMREEGVALLTRWTMWSAVRAASLFSPGRKYGRGFMADLPKIALVAIPAIVLIGPAALVNLITRGVLRVIHF